MIQTCINVAIDAAFILTIGLSFGLIYSVSRVLHFAHGAVYTAAAYFAYVLIAELNLSTLFSIPLAVAFAALLGASLERVVYRPLRRKGSTSEIAMLASLGIYITLQNIISLIFGDDMLSLRVDPIQEGFIIFGGRITENQITIILSGIACAIGLSLAWKYSYFGKQIRAISSDPDLASIVGVHIDKVFISAYFLGSALVGLSGVLISNETDLYPTMGFDALLFGIVATIIGGQGSLAGIALASGLISLVRQFSVLLLPTIWQDYVVLFILMVFLLLKPQGIFGTPVKKVTI